MISPPAWGVDDTALAIAIAAEEAPPPGAASGAPPAFADCMILLRASLMASASALAVVGDVNEKTCVSGSELPGAKARILSITLGLLAGVCWRSDNHSILSNIQVYVTS